MTPEDVDLVVIGSGQGGVPLAADFARRGKRVVLFERDRLGGSCVNFGCTPSKALLASAHNAGRARRAGPLGVHATVTVDQRAVFERVRSVREEWRSGVETKLAKAGVEVVRASAAFSGERTVRGGEREVRGERVVIDTGTTAALPPVHGLGDVPYFTNKTFFDQVELPPRLLVIGGGYIGLELGQGAQRLGCAVTIVHGSEHVMDREEHDAAAFVRSSMESDGVTFELHARATAVEQKGEVLAPDAGQRQNARGRRASRRHRAHAKHRRPRRQPLERHLPSRRLHRGRRLSRDELSRRVRTRRRRGPAAVHARLVGRLPAPLVDFRRQTAPPRRPGSLVHDVHRAATRAYRPHAKPKREPRVSTPRS